MTKYKVVPYEMYAPCIICYDMMSNIQTVMDDTLAIHYYYDIGGSLACPRQTALTTRQLHLGQDEKNGCFCFFPPKPASYIIRTRYTACTGVILH